MDVRETTWVITGGAGGIGSALARQVIADGASTVVIADLDEERNRGGGGRHRSDWSCL